MNKIIQIIRPNNNSISSAHFSNIKTTNKRKQSLNIPQPDEINNILTEIAIDEVPHIKKRKYTKSSHCPHCNLTGHVQIRSDQCFKKS